MRRVAAGLLVLAMSVTIAGCALVLGLEDHEAYPGSSVAFNAPVVLASGQQGPLGVTTDTARVYFVTEIDGTLASVEKRAGAPLSLLAQNLSTPKSVVLDDVRVYVARLGTCNGGVVSFLKDGSDPISGPQNEANCNGEDVRLLARAGASLYGLRSTSIVLDYTLPLGSVSTLATQLDGLTGLTARDSEVYFTSTSKGIVYQMKPPSTAVVAFGQNQPGPGAATIDDTFVYWLNTDGSIAKLARASPGGTPTVIATKQPSLRNVALFDGNLYFTCEDGTVRRVSTSGGDVATLATGQEGATGIAVDAQGVYWTNRTAGTVMMAARAAQ